ncbi:MAG TPA: hypothetical protein VF430_04215, partial [Verrucomicrobiae bacterium]
NSPMLYEVFIMSMVYALPQGESQGDFSELSRGFAGGRESSLGVLMTVFYLHILQRQGRHFFWQFLDCRDKVFSDFISAL